MRYIKYIFLATLFLCFALETAFAQSGLTISAGSSIFISSGTILSTDSLVLVPSASLTINGSNAETMDAVITHPSVNPHIQRVFHFLNTLPSFTGDITIYYQDAELNGIPENQLTLNVHNGILWNDYTMNTTRDATNNFVAVTGLTNIAMNELTLANVLAPLPIIFILINTHCLDHGETISWTTEQELNSRDFAIESSMDGSNWKIIGSLPITGNSDAEHSYSFTDNATSAAALYRIVEFDFDGRQTISPVVKSSCSIGETIAIYPNPARDILFISINSTEKAPVLLQLYNSGGGLVKQVQANLQPGVNEMQLNISGISAGNYILNAQWGNNSKTSKIIKE